MESSAGGDGGAIGADCAVGTIVWVRRRNGSWWPGRILGLGELSASHLMSPRSGTPVKLLGREDASVDWYNLEKSKRVKTFRCGEFDACIERAEASQGAPIKKREKYARREDAILHALELEKKQSEDQQQQLGITAYLTNNKISGIHKCEPSNFDSPEPYTGHDEHGSHMNLLSDKPQNILTKIDISQEENLIDCYVKKRRISKQLRRQDDNSEVMPRMRGLQDFGLRTVQSKRKSSQTVNWQNFSKHLDSHAEMLSSSGCMLDDVVHASSSKNSITVKRKRSQNRMVDDSLIKKRDRRRPLVQVLESSAKVVPHLLKCSSDDVGLSMPNEKEHMLSICKAKRSRCVYFTQNSDDPDSAVPDSEHLSVLEDQFGANKCLDSPNDVVKEYVSSGLIEANDSDSSEIHYLEHDLGGVENMWADAADMLLPGSKDCEPPEFQVPDHLRILNGDEIPNSGTISQLHDYITDFHEDITDASAEVGVSKWHMKGKRNTRNIGKRPMHAVDGKIYSSENCNGSMNIEKTELSNQRAALTWGIHTNKESLYTCDDGVLIENDLAHDQSNLYCDWRKYVPTQSKDDGRRSHSSHNDSDNNSHVQTPSIAHSAVWEEPVEHSEPVYEFEPLLVDIDIKVEASYQGEHVPLVSLMSRLNGKAIIGHPIQIELLESGSTGNLVSKLESVIDEASGPPPVWRTARRTAMQRVPRLNPPTAAVEDEDPDTLRHSRHTTPSKKSSSRSSQSRSRKFQKKNLKRLSLSSQKTRTLSSLANNYKLDGGSGGIELAASNDILDGLIKPKGSAPLVACVPVKVVFSRLLEAVGKPSSTVARRVRANSPAVRDPS